MRCVVEAIATDESRCCCIHHSALTLNPYNRVRP
jgi:hypothetical protein